MLGKEKQAIEKLAPRVRTATLASLLTDAEMADCDRRATDKLILRLKNRHIQRTYMEHFINESLWYKNALALDKLKSKRRFFAVYYSPGLGIHSRFLGGIRRRVSGNRPWPIQEAYLADLWSKNP